MNHAMISQYQGQIQHIIRNYITFEPVNRSISSPPNRPKAEGALLKEMNRLKSNRSANSSVYALLMVHCLLLLLYQEYAYAPNPCTESIHGTTETSNANMRYPRSPTPSPAVAKNFIQNKMTLKTKRQRFMRAEPADLQNPTPQDTQIARLLPEQPPRDQKALILEPYPRAVLVLSANSPSPTQQARPPIQCCTLSLRL
ncbi:hypothetical protein BDR22DRAFT_42174 [Usnea florida]